MKKYIEGEKIGPYNILFVSEIPKEERGEKHQKTRMGQFICPYCGKIFKSAVSSVGQGLTKSCGCLKKKNAHNFIDLTGKKFGYLTVIARDGINKDKRATWKCICECGNEIAVNGRYLRNGTVKSCGCKTKQMMRDSHRKDLTGNRFGNLIAIETVGMKNHLYLWKCKCDCGKICYVTSNNLIRGNNKSCGCIKSRGENKIERIFTENNVYFLREYVFKECFNPETKKPFRFDFYLPDYNCCIEYDGEQHYYGWGHGLDNKESLKIIQKRDSIKNNFCASNGIKLVRIPYTDFKSISIEYLMEKIK